MINVLFVCLGNICRSPMAEAVFRKLVEEAGLADQIHVDSAGTAEWHVGEPADYRTLAILRQHGIQYDGVARRIQSADLRRFDYIIAMDGSNMADVTRLDRSGVLNGKLYRLMDFAPPGSPRDVPDPYYDGRFEYVYRLVEAGCRGLLEHIRSRHGL